EPASARRRRQAPGLSSGEVAVLPCKVLLGREEGGLADQEVDAVGELECPVAPGGVHHDGHALARPAFAHLRDAHGATVYLQSAEGLETTDVRTDHADRGKTIRQHPASLRLIEAPPERVDPMLEGHAPQCETFVGIDGLAS